MMIKDHWVIGSSGDCGKREDMGIRRGQQLMSSGQALPWGHGSSLLPDLLNLEKPEIQMCATSGLAAFSSYFYKCRVNKAKHPRGQHPTRP